MSAADPINAPLDALMRLAPVIPVVTPRDIDSTVELARALLRGGLPTMEITLRNPVALDALRAVATEVPEVYVGAGTVLDPAQLEAAVEAGARFLVSPGSPADLLRAAAAQSIPLLPGVATATEVMTAMSLGWTRFKLFPASAVGGTALLRGLAGPLPQVRFCPTGGITPATAADYLACPNVLCIGGSWLTPVDAIEQRDWSRIQTLAAAAAALRPAA